MISISTLTWKEVIFSGLFCDVLTSPNQTIYFLLTSMTCSCSWSLCVNSLLSFVTSLSFSFITVRSLFFSSRSSFSTLILSWRRSCDTSNLLLTNWSTSSIELVRRCRKRRAILAGRSPWQPQHIPPTIPLHRKTDAWNDYSSKCGRIASERNGAHWNGVLCNEMECLAMKWRT